MMDSRVNKTFHITMQMVYTYIKTKEEKSPPNGQLGPNAFHIH
jgi:hypothetical protein